MTRVRLHLLQLVVGVSLLFAMGGFCPLPEEAVYGRPCVADGECGAGYVCTLGHCARPVDPQAPTDAGRRDASPGEGEGEGELDGGLVDSGPLGDGGLDDGGVGACSPSDCDDGLYCNGAETCGPDGACQPGTPPCADTGLFCDEASDACLECLVDADCDDGLFCNGADTCVDGTCVHAGDPCVASGENCLEASDTCAACTSAAECDDGNPCNGEETCAGGACQAGTPPCGANELCLTNPLRCAECTNDGHCAQGVCVNERCVECRDDSQCDDGLFCNGVEACDPATNLCLLSLHPCLGATPVCDEGNDICVQCTDNEHCGGDTPFCSANNQCVGCRSNADCPSDGDPCNGDEVCDVAAGVCTRTSPPCEGITPYCYHWGGGLFTCAECLADRDCPVNQICDDNFRCCQESGGPIAIICPI